MAKKKTDKKPRTRIQLFFSSWKGDVAVIVGGLALYGLLVGVAITASSIWFDEAFSAYIVRHNFLEIAQYTAVDVHPPLYYWALSAWTHLFGTTELAFRSMSAVFGGVVIILGFLLSKKLFGRRAAWLAVLFLALSPILIRLGQEARMYTMVTAIAFGATLMLLRAIKTDRRRDWVIYGVLLSLGMWTHYFAALVWLAHWAWRWLMLRRQGNKGKKLFGLFFSKNWIIAHVVAIALFAPWMSSMISQFATIQQGFWIGPVGVGTPFAFLTSAFFYLENGQVLGWYALWFFAIVAAITWLGIATYRKMKKGERTYFWLALFMIIVPTILLFLASLPPLKSVFVERYLVPSTAFIPIFIALAIAYSAPYLRRLAQVGVLVLFVASFAFGISNVYYYGNYNKNSHVSIQTRQLVEAMRERAAPGEPLIANSPWIYYEASFYDSEENPIYFLESTTENYKYGSLEMLKNDTKHKITDLATFMKQHPRVWYFGNVGASTMEAPAGVGTWKRIRDVKVTDPIDKKSDYKAAEFTLSEE